MAETGNHFRPYVQIAAFCQAALQEAAGTLSLIRITDRVGVTGTTEEMHPSQIQGLTLVVVLKSGFMRGRSNVTIRPNSPSGEVLPTVEMTVLFEGDERGVGIILPMAMIAKEEGLYWFDVLVDEDLFTRIPLRVIYQRLPRLGAPPATT
jgi:hypothetical protein